MAESQRFNVGRWLISVILLSGFLALLIFYVSRFFLQPDIALIQLAYNGAPFIVMVSIAALLGALLLRTPHLIGFYLLMTILGVGWVGAPLVPLPYDDAVRGVPLDIVTFNMYPQNEQFDEATAWLVDQDADLVLVQEAFGDLRPLEAAYEHTLIDADHGRAAFSRFPMVLQGMEQVDGSIQRLQLEIDEIPVMVYNVHLLMPLDPESDAFFAFRYLEEQRNAQIRALLDDVAEQNMPVIVAGDFNTSEYSPIYAEIRAVLGDAYRRAESDFGWTWPAGEFEDFSTPPWLPPLIRIDYVLYSDDFEAIRAAVGPQLGSDHNPLSATLDLR